MPKQKSRGKVTRKGVVRKAFRDFQDELSGRRKFNGKVYTARSRHRYKETAQKEAEFVRRHGGMARVFFRADGRYDVFERWERPRLLR